METLIATVGRYLPLKQNGAGCVAKCPFHNDDGESLRVDDKSWRCVACGSHDGGLGDAAGWLMCWSQCSREEAEQLLGNGELPEPIPIQTQPLKQLPFWGWRWLDKLPGARCWIHERTEGVHGGREYYEQRVHLGLIDGRPWTDLSLLAGRECILLPVNRESSMERMDALAAALYAAGHKVVKWIDPRGQEDSWAWPLGMGKDEAVEFAKKHVLTYPPSNAAPDPAIASISSSQGLDRGAASDTPAGTLGTPPAPDPDDPGAVAPPGTPKARKTPPDLNLVDETGALRKPRLELANDPELPAFSEFALAKSFADGPGVDWRYTAAWGLWAKWDGIRWVQDERKLITWEAKNCCAAVMQDHLADSTPAQRLKVATFRTTNSVIGLAMADPRIATGAEQWDADPWLLGTPAGIVDLRTGQAIAADKAQFISKSTLIAPAAGTHPLFDMVIARPGTGTGMLPFLWRWLGYILSGDVREERFLFLHGLGNSGKGTLIKVIADILGDYAKVVAIQAFTESQHQRHSQEIAKLQGARFVYASETEEGSRFDEAMLKWLTGRDKITAHKMRQDDIEFYPQFKLLIYGNNRPSLKSVGEDMRRRIDLIEFPGTIPESERDSTLKDRLREEYPAILASMIAACVSWQTQG